ncbi:GNAT family N-acetyltransferase [Streptomyces sp. NPDC051567]|uniref:GNAT family N-acetyltransferase n=1 Tax=Streptomyces sp. NPDC051567 TaxID=3365660 RepID=UPI0037B382E1
MTDTTTVLAELERYCDAVPRVGGARAEEFGPLTLFVQEGTGWPYYARPALGGPAGTAADVRRVRARQRELGLRETFEWLDGTAPWLRAAAEAAGLEVHAYPLMVLEPSAAPLPAHPRTRLLTPDDPLLRAAVTVPELAFADPGTRVGGAGPVELAEAVADPEARTRRERVAEMVASGRTVVAATARDGVVLCSGQYNPVGDVGEVVGVGTLPSARRQGLAVAVTAALVARARALGARTVFLSASDEDVARVYARVGFRRVGTASALVAQPPG